MSDRSVAYLTSQYPAASHTFIRREVEALREKGWTIHTFSIRTPGNGEACGERDRIEQERTFYVLSRSATEFLLAHLAALVARPPQYFRTFILALRHRAPGVRGLVLALAHFAESILLARELERRKVPHLHNHFANSAATVGLLAARFLGIGWSFTMHGISETDYPAGLMLGRKIEAATFVTCVSWFGRAQGLRLVEPQHWDKVKVVRCGIPFERLPQRTRQKQDRKLLVCVGRLSPEKGQAGLLHALAGLRDRHPDLQLRLVGDGPDRPLLEKLVKDLGLEETVTFTGRLPEDQTLHEIAQGDILVLSSFMEGLPIVLMEALALEVPVIASRVAGIPELVDDGSTGLLFAPSDWADLESKIDRLLTDEDLRAAMARSAPLKVRAEFDTRKSAGTMASLFSQVPGTLAR